MKLSVVSDSHGNILSLFSAPPQLPLPSRNEKGRARIGVHTYLPNPGEQVHVVEIPPEHERRPLGDLHTNFRLEVSKGTAKLVPIEESKESR